MAYVFNRNGRWVVEWKDAAGKYRQRRTKCETKAEAKRLVRDLELKAERQRDGLAPLDAPTRLTFGELLTWYWQEFGAQRRSDRDHISAEYHLRPRLGEMALAEVTPGKIDSVLANLKKKPRRKGAEATELLAPKSLNNLRAHIQTMFSKAKQRELWRGGNPAESVPERRVPQRLPSWLRPEEVRLVLPEVPAHWRALFATAVYTGLRRGELVALRKADVDLAGGTLTVGASWGSDTTKGSHADVLPIHPELRPYLAEAIKRTPSKLVFPREDGSMHSENIDLPGLLRSALNRAGLSDGWTHKCRRCSHQVPADDAELRTCPVKGCGMKMWPSPNRRKVRFHDMRHTTATLLLKAGAPMVVVSKILRHKDVRTTVKIYGHIDTSDMSAALDRLSFTPTPTEHTEPAAQVLPIAVNESPAPVLRNADERGKTRATSSENPEEARALLDSGPSWIRTRDQSVMSRGRGAEHGLAPLSTGSPGLGVRGGRDVQTSAPLGTASTASTETPAPVLRPTPGGRRFRQVPRLLRVRDVAELLNVSTATVYALVEQGELERLWVANSIRVSAESVDAYIKRARGGR